MRLKIKGLWKWTSQKNGQISTEKHPFSAQKQPKMAEKGAIQPFFTRSLFRRFTALQTVNCDL